MQINHRTYDFRDLIVSNQRDNAPAPPANSPHYLGLSIGEADVFTSGTTLLASIKANPGTQYLTHIAIGTDDTPLDPTTQTGLIAEVYRDQITLFDSIVPLALPNATLIEQLFIPASATGVNVHIKEIAIFGNNGTDMFCRQLLDYDNTNPVNLIISWLVNFTTP